MTLGAVVLAAGAGTRLGGVAKALLRAPGSSQKMRRQDAKDAKQRFMEPRHEVVQSASILDGETYLARIVRVAREVGAREIVVVVGPPYADAVRQEATRLAAPTIENPDPQRGMASSVALGFAAMAKAGVDAAWLWPVDHPFVEPTTLHEIVDALDGHDVAQPRFAGRGGHPPLVGRALFAALAACTEAPGGARDVLAGADVVAVAVDDAAVVRDVDTPADLAEAR